MYIVAMARNFEIEYLTPDERQPDTQYRDLLEHILRHGRTVRPIQGEEARMIMGAQLHYPMPNGFPVITERDLSGVMFKNALAEHVAFLNGARTQEQLESFGCGWWAKWLTEERCAIFGLEQGDMGDGSYGAAWTDFPTKDGGSFDQIEHLVRQIKERPYLRTHVLTPWIPQYTLQHSELQREVVVAPCHGNVHVFADPTTEELTVHHIQRSGDLPVGVPFNMIQYAAFGLMLARLTGYTFTEMVQTFSDVHIYESQYPHVEELISREPRVLGTVTLSPEADGIENIKDFRPEHFTLTDYEPHKRMLIPTPV
jgi:thymidylate synthase